MSLDEGHFAAWGRLKYRVKGGTVREGRELVCVYKVMGAGGHSQALAEVLAKSGGMCAKELRRPGTWLWSQTILSSNSGSALCLCDLGLMAYPL